MTILTKTLIEMYLETCFTILSQMFEILSSSRAGMKFIILGMTMWRSPKRKTVMRMTIRTLLSTPMAELETDLRVGMIMLPTQSIFRNERND